MEIIEIPESFINFCSSSSSVPCSETDAGCVETIGACYPMYEVDDLHFQVVIQVGSSDPNLDGIVSGAIKFYVTLANSCEECDANELKMAQLHVEQWKTSGSDQYDFFVLSLSDWNDASPFISLSEADCFTLCLVAEGLVGSPTLNTLLGCSPCFIKVTQTCDTSKIQYRQNETSMGFYNNGNPFYDIYFNSIRLPFRLHQPQPKTKKNVYRLSNGNYIKNSASKSMEWKGETDMMSEKWHRKFDISLDHDQIKITNTNSGFTNGFFMSESNDNYKIDWQEFLDYPHAKAEFTLLQMPFNEFNNNCNLTPINPITDVNALLVDGANLLSWD